MSKASEYAKNYKEISFGDDDDLGGDDLGCDVVARVTTGGSLAITRARNPISADEAIKFARWILETFGD